MKKILALLLTLCFLSEVVYGDLSWNTPTAISSALTDASAPQVVMDSNANVTAIWIEGGVVKSSSLPSGGSWSSIVSLSNPLNTSTHTLLGVDSSGNVTALWIENSVIESATLPFGGSWGAETLPISGSGVSNPAMAVDASGNVVAVWQRSGFIESSTRKSGIWSLVSVLSAANSAHPSVAISSFGTAVAAWQTISSGNDVIVTNTLTISSNTWSINKNVFSGTAAFSHDYPHVALDPSGNAFLAWFRYNLVDSNAYENVQVFISSLTQGASAWSIASIVSGAGIRNPADLSIELICDTSGNAMAVWTNSYDGQSFSVESSQKLLGANWLVFITAQISLYSFRIDLSGTTGPVVLTTMFWDGSNINIQSQESDTTNPVDQSWTLAQTLSIGGDNFINNAISECASVIIGNTQNAVAVWLHYDGSNQVIHASTGTETMIDPPSSVSATQSSTNFGVYTDYYNTITWSASTDPDVVQYNIFRNGVFFAATDGATFTFVDHNQIQSGAVTYGISAFTTEFRQSAIVTYTLF